MNQLINMEKLNFEQIVKKLKEYYTEDKKGNFDNNIIDCLVDSLKYNENDLNLGQINKVDSYGGEGEGEKYYDVFHFVNQDLYIKISGY